MSNEVRCLNCLKRFTVQPKAETTQCPNCKTRYRVSWLNTGQAKIRGQA